MKKNHLLFSKLFFVLLLTSFFQSNVHAEEQGFWSKVWGDTGPTNIYLAMFSYHIISIDQTDYNNNPTFGIATHGAFMGTYLNSWGQQSIAGGIQRYWLDKTYSNNLNLRLGYRLGVIFGYHTNNPSRFNIIGQITQHQPLVPFPQFITELTWHHMGLQVGIAGVVISATFYLSP